MKRIFITLILVGGILAGTAFFFRDWFTRQAFAPTQRTVSQPGFVPAEEETGVPDSKEENITTIAQDLSIPWEIAFLPGGDLLVTERPGRLLRIGQDKQVIPVNGVRHVGEGGLLGLALHPDFASNNFVYLYLTTTAGSGLTNRVERYVLSGNELSGRTVILEHIPGAQFHDGGRIAFGPDEKLYITTGDAGTEANAQNRESLAGKILRLNDDGSIPMDNPFKTAIWSYGHRNPQGITWDEDGNLWATEHGRSGTASGFDEVNLIKPGKNYGWPTIEGDATASGMETPKANSGAKETWAPSGAAYLDGSIYFAGLRGEALYEAAIDGTNIPTIKAHLAGEFGRLRTVAVGPDGFLYILTSNKDGRGVVKPSDDKIIRINPELLKS